MACFIVCMAVNGNSVKVSWTKYAGGGRRAAMGRVAIQQWNASAIKEIMGLSFCHARYSLGKRLNGADVDWRNESRVFPRSFRKSWWRDSMVCVRSCKILVKYWLNQTWSVTIVKNIQMFFHKPSFAYGKFPAPFHHIPHSFHLFLDLFLASPLSTKIDKTTHRKEVKTRQNVSESSREKESSRISGLERELIWNSIGRRRAQRWGSEINAAMRWSWNWFRWLLRPGALRLFSFSFDRSSNRWSIIFKSVFFFRESHFFRVWKCLKLLKPMSRGGFCINLHAGKGTRW